MSLTAYPRNPAADATAMIVFSGPPNVAVAWSLAGPGAIAPLSGHTDERGVAGAVFTPGAVGNVVTVSVLHGA